MMSRYFHRVIAYPGENIEFTDQPFGAA